MEKSGQDDLGRFAFICTTIQGRKVAFVSVYAPAVFDSTFYPWLTSELITLTEYDLIIGGDMNACAQLDIDRSSSIQPSHAQHLASAALNTFIRT